MSSIGLSTSYFKENNKDFKTEYKPEPTVTFTHLFDYKGKKLGYSTNRIDNWFSGRKKQDIKLSNGVKAINQQLITYDSFLVGRQFNRFIPMLYLANAKIDNKIIVNNNVKRKINHVYLYGANLIYLINNEVSASVSYIAPSQEIELEGGISIGINYNF
jgi:hypothetical protein